MTNLRFCSQLLASCASIYRGQSVRWVLCDASKYRVLVQQTNSFWKKKDKCPPPSDCCCTEQPNENAEDALPDYCEKKKEAECNLQEKLKCAKEEYNDKIKQIKQDYKCQTKTAKENYENQTNQAKEKFKEEQCVAEGEYCENTKPVMQCYKTPPPVPVSCCEEPKDECEKKESAEEECDEPKKKNSKKPKKDDDNCDDEPKKKKKGKKKDDDCDDEPKKKNKKDDDDCDEEPKKKKKNDDCDDDPKDKTEDDCEEPKKAVKKGKSKKRNKKGGNCLKMNKKPKGENENCPKERKDLSEDSMVTSRLTGMEMPVLILGTFKMRDILVTQKALKTAFEVGYRAIDTAISYGNDDVIGCALPYALEEAQLERQDIFIITKLPPDAMRCDIICETLEKSLKNLKTPYVDLFLINFPVGLVKDEETGSVKADPKTDHKCLWKCMESLVENGKTKYIGVANFSCDQLENIVTQSKIKPSTVQVELHLLFQQKKFRKAAKELGVPVTAYAPLGVSQAVIDFLKKACNEDVENAPNILDDPLIQALAKRKCKEPGQLILRYLLQSDDQLAVTIGAISPNIITENFNIFDFSVDEGDKCVLEKQDKGKAGRLFNREVFKSIFPGVEKSPLFPWKE